MKKIFIFFIFSAHSQIHAMQNKNHQDTSQQQPCTYCNESPKTTKYKLTKHWGTSIECRHCRKFIAGCLIQEHEKTCDNNRKNKK